LSNDPRTGGQAPGYDYSIIFSKGHVFTKRSHSSAYLNNPTVLSLDKFGEANWKLRTLPAELIRDAVAMRAALESWRQLTARTTFTSDDGAREFTVEYPIKWADFNLDSTGFRVETGPIFLLDPNRVQVGKLPSFADFQWAHFDYHTFDKVRCLMERPTSILADATFTPPQENGRDVRKTVGLTATQIDSLRQSIYANSSSRMPRETLDLLLSTDHYSLAKEFIVRTEVYTFD